MTLKSRLCATALAIGLSMPASATTLTFDIITTRNGPVGSSANPMFLMEGPETTLTQGFRIGRTITLLPEPPAVSVRLPGDYWEFSINFNTPSPVLTPEDGGSFHFGGGCWLANELCFVEPYRPSLFHGGLFSLSTFWGSAGFWADYRPTIQVTMVLPEDVTISHMPLPASWALFASMLGLGGLFRWARHRSSVA